MVEGIPPRTRGGVRILRVILNEQNAGVAEGRNIGWRAARRPLMMNLDDDTRIDRSAIRSLAASIRQVPHVGVVFPRILDFTTEADLTPFGDSPKATSNFHGACHVVRREAFQAVGMIDPLCRFGGEEFDYSVRMRACGWEVLFLPGIRVAHNGIARSGAMNRFRRTEWLYNYVRVVFKHFPQPIAPLLAMRLFASHAVSGARLHGATFLPSLLKASVKGAIDGRREISPCPQLPRSSTAARTFDPDFGNIPLRRKASSMLRRRWYKKPQTSSESHRN